MRSHFTRRIPLPVRVVVALAVLAFGFLAFVGLRSLAGTASANPGAPTPVGHEWSQVENHGTSGSPVDTYWLGTPGTQALELKVNNARALRLEPTDTSPNVIGGYSGNSVDAGVTGAAIGGGGYYGLLSGPNRVTDSWGTVSGGNANQAGDADADPGDAGLATVGGGWANGATGQIATVGGGAGNQATLDYATVGGGGGNIASGQGATVGGGASNNASAQFATIAGGGSDTAGSGNRATDDHGTVGGGENNQAGDNDGDTANRPHATVGGGSGNTASGQLATVGGGSSNTASSTQSTVGGGGSNTASGIFATVPGGAMNTAQGNYSFSAGRRAKANDIGSFVWADTSDFDFASTAANEFAVRSTGGARVVTAIDGSGVPTAGVKLDSGDTAWEVLSDRAAKENFVTVDPQLVLSRLSEVPITEWNYKAQDSSIRHIGPTAQDFYAAFGLSNDGLYISPIDTDGVALAAIQGLYQFSQEQASRIAALENENASLNQRLDSLEARVSALEGGTGAGAAVSTASSSGVPALWPVLGGGLALVLVGLVLGRRLAGARR